MPAAASWTGERRSPTGADAAPRTGEHRHSGFSDHDSLTVPAGDGRALEALARYCLRNPVGLARLRFAPGAPTAMYLPRDGDDGEKVESLDALDFIACLLAYVPDPGRHRVHDYADTGPPSGLG